ncbi:MAG: serine protease [Reyranellales bacterium]
MSDTFKRLALWAAIVAALYGVSTLFDLGDLTGPRRPLPPDPGGGAWIRSEPAAAPVGSTPDNASIDMIVAESTLAGKDVIGTAFLVAPKTWVTAAHVLEDCKAGYVRVQGTWRQVRQNQTHPSADVAVLVTDSREAPPVLGVTDRPPVLDQDGFHVGYPQGVPSTVRTKFIGMARIRHGKPGSAVEMGWVWAELERQPPTTGPLGGISGGPQVDRTGAVQGVTILYAERSARLTTTPVSRVREVLPDNVPHVQVGGARIDETDFVAEGEQARATSAVALVFCSASGHTRPRR